MKPLAFLFMLAFFLASCSGKAAAPVREKYPQQMIGSWQCDLTNFTNDNRAPLLARIRREGKNLSREQEEQLLLFVTKRLANSLRVMFTLNNDGSASYQKLAPEVETTQGTWSYSHDTQTATMMIGRGVHQLHMEGAELICEVVAGDYGLLMTRQQRVASSSAAPAQ